MPCSGSFSSPSTQAAIALAGFLHSTPGDTGLASAGEHHLADHQGKEPLRCKPKPRAVPAGLVPAALHSEARCRASKPRTGRGCAPAPAAWCPREKCRALGAEAAGQHRGSTGTPTSRWLLMAESSAGPTGGLCHLLLQLVTVGTPLLKSMEQK